MPPVYANLVVLAFQETDLRVHDGDGDGDANARMICVDALSDTSHIIRPGRTLALFEEARRLSSNYPVAIL